MPTSPQWETRAKRPLPGGRWPGIDNSLWLWRVAPLGPVVDARSPRDAVDVGRPLLNAYAELAALAGLVILGQPLTWVDAVAIACVVVASMGAVRAAQRADPSTDVVA